MQESGTTTLRYFAILRGRISPCYSLVTLSSNASVLNIIQEIGKQINHLPVDILLWKPRDFLPKGGCARLRSLHREYGGDLSKFCNEMDRDALTSDIFGSGVRADKITTLVAEVPEPIEESVTVNAAEYSDEARDVLTKLKPGSRKALQSGPSGPPSQNCRPPDYYRHQNGPNPILDGRYGDFPNTIAPPVEDFHYAFASFVAQYGDEHMELPEGFVRKIGELMDSTSKISIDEKRRQSDTRLLLSRILSATFTQLVNSNRTSADHMLGYSRERAPLGFAPLAIVEEKAELGSSGDGSVQGSFSYTQHWIDANQHGILQACFCPSFVIAVAGPYITICGAILTSSVIVHRFTDYIWLANSRLNDDANTHRIARIFYALGNALVRLRSFYAELEEPSNEGVRYFPLATAYRDGERIINFKYVAYLKDTDEACVTYRAVECNNARRQIVVKFVERYGESAHKLLASHGLAPRLLYCGDIWLDGPERHGCGSRKMVVMEYIEGMTAHAMLHRDRKRVLPGGVHDAIKRAVKLLHDEGMVHGDIRLDNVIVAEGTGGDDDDIGKRVRLVDFDWAGPEGVVRYPLRLSKTINWPDGVADYAFITAEHDDEMVRGMGYTWSPVRPQER